MEQTHGQHQKTKQQKSKKSTFLHIEHLCDGAMVLAELPQQAWGNGEQIAARQSFHLTRVSEGSAHHYGAVAILLVVVVNLGHTQHTYREEERVKTTC